MQRNRTINSNKENKMNNRWHYSLALLSALALPLYAPLACAQSYPEADRLAEQVIERYRSASCEEIKERRTRSLSPEQEKRRHQIVEQLLADPSMRTHFLNKIAGPIANRMFDCGLIP
jgi:hypothetical protein